MYSFGTQRQRRHADLLRMVEALELAPVAPGMTGDSSPKLTVETVDNHVYFYADVDSDHSAPRSPAA